MTTINGGFKSEDGTWVWADVARVWGEESTVAIGVFIATTSCWAACCSHS